MNRVHAFLKAPFPTIATPMEVLVKCLLFSLFVFLFLLLFQPFGLGLVGKDLALVTAGYGLTCLLVMLGLNMGIPKLLPAFFEENVWNCGKEIVWTLLNLLSIGFFNALYTANIHLFPLGLETIARLELYTLMVGIFPVIASVLAKRERMEKRYAKQSQSINELIGHEKSQANHVQPSMIAIHPENAKDSFAVDVDDLLLVRGADNYVEVYFVDGGRTIKKMVRISMKAVEASMLPYPQIMRCHKSYLVNLGKVVYVSGNAQGLKLHLADTDQIVPVSRNLTKVVRARLVK